MSTRVYVGTTLPGLSAMLGDGGVGPSPFRAHAVTEAVRREWPEAEAEEMEYAALSAAALDSVRMLGPDDPARRVVVALDVETVQAPDIEDAPSVVDVIDVAPWRMVAAVHIDDAAAEDTVAAAREALAAEATAEEADDTEETDEAEVRLEACLDHELGWYAAQEVPALLEE